MFDVLQMALWLQTRGNLYLPPSKPVATVMSTDAVSYTHLTLPTKA